MKCPVCTTVDLNMSERQGVEIDYCPNCRGVWLDRGELDKIIERSSSFDDDYDDDPRYRQQDANRKQQEYNNSRDYPRGKRRKSFLGDMFDIFD